MANNSESFDLIIIGGGLVGNALACALAPHLERIALVEAREPSVRLEPSFDARTIGVSHASKCILDNLGLWDAIVPHASPMAHIHVSQQGYLGLTQLHADEHEVNAFGYVVEMQYLTASLEQALQELSNVKRFCPATLTGLVTTQHVADVTLNVSGSEVDLTAPLVVAADGNKSTVRKLAGIGSSCKDYGQTAVISNLRFDKSNPDIAFERFTKTGTLAVLPLTGDRCGLVWSLPSVEAQALLATDDASFIAAIQQGFGYRLGRITQLGRRQAYPLQLITADNLSSERVICIGNAAQSIHPIAAQGLNLGWRDAAVLAEKIVTCAGDIGSESLLTNYVAARTADRKRTINFADGLVSMFAAEFPPLAHMRGLGMMAVDLVPVLKQRFARGAMGTRGRSSKLAAGMPL